MPSVTFIDGVATPPERATVSIHDRGFLYGDTVFETLRTYGGAPHLLDDHLARLRGSATSLGIELALSSAVLASEVVAAIAASQELDAVVRITISRGEGGPGIDPRAATRPHRVVHVAPLSSRVSAAGSGPVAVRLVASRRGAALAPAAKIGAYVDAILALRIAHAAGDDDAVLTDPEGFLLEATTANVFVVTAAGEVVTPPPGAVFPGLTRREVLRIAGEMGLPTAERSVAASDLRSASEAFLTSSVRELLPIGRVDGAPMPGAAPGPTTARLLAAYRAALPRGP